MIAGWSGEDLLLLVVFVALLLLGLVLLWRLLIRPGKPKLPAESTIFLDGAERAFLESLEAVLGGEFRVFPKVALKNFLRPHRQLSAGRGREVQKKLEEIHADFLVCSAADLSVIGVIVLEPARKEKTHKPLQPGAEFLEAAGIPLVVLPAWRPHAPEEIRAVVDAAFLAAEKESEWQLGALEPGPEENWSRRGE